MKPLLIMVGADKGGVGKTMVSRILSDYLATHGRNFHAFDTESPTGVLQRFHPSTTEVVDLTQVSEQMKVFDALEKNGVTLVDVRAGLLSPTLQSLADVGLLEMVKNKQVELVVLHVLGPTIASLSEIEATSKVIEGAVHFLVKNHINDTNFFEWDKALHDRAFGASRSGILEIPRLNELSVENVEAAGVTFSQFVSNRTKEDAPASYSMVLRGYTRTWLKEVHSELDRVNVNGIVGQAASA